MTKLLIFFLIHTISCEQDIKTNFILADGTEASLVEAFPNLDFERPVDLQGCGDGSNRIFVVEQKGIISVFENRADVESKEIFLDISHLVDDRSNEEGLLGLAFHPNFKTNGYFYVNYTVSSSETIISRFKVSETKPNVAELSSQLIFLRFSQPYGNHNGGQVAFGPDGFLYIAIGDGGSRGDPKKNGQNKSTLLGSIARIDVDKPSQGLNYSIPADNPFVESKTFKKEIFAYGLRNPWRISFDPITGDLWCADVGQNKFEEVNIIKKGANYGWNIMEGFHAYNNSEEAQDGLTLPIWEIAQSTGDRSITGGYVYRGKLTPSLYGKYIFGDYVSGKVYALSFKDNGVAQNLQLLDSNLTIASFGTDDEQELYVCSFNGKIYRFQE